MELVNNFIQEAKNNNFFLTAAQIRKNGEIVEEWSRFETKLRFETYSIAKTFTGVGVGIAIDEGLITLDERIVDSFPEASYDITNENALNITVRDLLTMNSGMSEGMLWRDGDERKYERDWIRYVYKNGKFDHKPGTFFLYNNANTYMLSCLIEKKSGQNLREYLRYRLFEPIGIGNVEWTSCPMGHTVAANSLYLNIDELGNLGQLIANGGEFNGKRIVSESYIKEMTKTHIKETGEMIATNPPINVGYGYQIWTDDVNHLVYLWGIFGQYCIIIPEKNIVITVMGLEKSDGGSLGEFEVSPLRTLIWERLVIKL